MTRDELMAGFRAGRKLIVDRRDAPVLPLLLEMEREGLIVSEFIQYDEQSSALRFQLKEKQDALLRNTHPL